MIDLSKLPQEAPDYDLRDLLEAGCHFGHQRSKWNPKMDEYIYMEKDGVHIFDLAQTAEQLQHAYNYLYKMGKEGKKVVVVGTKRAASKIVEEQASEAGMQYITSRWLGGFLTNWEQVSKSLRRMLKIEKGLEEGKYAGYTKYEVVQLEKELNRLKRFFDGVRDLKDRPDALFIIDPRREVIAAEEAKQMDVPIVALVDSNTDPTGIDIPVPANDDAVKSIQFLVSELTNAYKAGKEA